MSAGSDVRNRDEWRVELEAAIRPLASSVTARRHGLPPLDNAAYRKLAEEATVNPAAARALREYLVSTHADPSDVIDLIVEHPDVGEVFDGEGEDAATFVAMPGGGFRVELKQMAGRIARVAIIRGEAAAARETDELLALAGRGRLPGYEVAVVRGLTVERVTPLGPGAFVTTYSDAVKRGLARKREPEPLGFGPDHEADGASVVYREMTWRPCLVKPLTSADIGKRPPTAKFGGRSGPMLNVVLGCLSLVTERRVELVEILSCAPAFTDIIPNLAPGSSMGYVITDEWPAEDLTRGHASKVGSLLQAWPGVKGGNQRRLELGLARLVSSTRRNRGRFWIEDRILDVAVALEVLYSLDAGELTHKLSTRAAYLLGSGSAEDRVDVFDAVRDLYEVRSSIVHGRGRMDRAERERAQQVAKRGFDIGRESLVVLLNRRVEPNWKRVTLSAEE